MARLCIAPSRSPAQALIDSWSLLNQLEQLAEWKPGQANIAPVAGVPLPSRQYARVSAASGAHVVAAAVADGKLQSWVRTRGAWARLEDVSLAADFASPALFGLTALPSGSAVATVVDLDAEVIKVYWLNTAA